MFWDVKPRTQSDLFQACVQPTIQLSFCFFLDGIKLHDSPHLSHVATIKSRDRNLCKWPSDCGTASPTNAGPQNAFQVRKLLHADER